MNRKKIELIIRNMELLIQSLKLELEEEKEEEKNLIKIQDLLTKPYETVDEYEPDYYEER